MIDIIIPTFNRHEAITRVINDLLKQTNQDFTLYIIDQSKSAYINQISTPFKVKIIWKPDFRSPILARDYGVQISTSEVMLFIDDDMQPKNDLIENINKIFKEFHGPLVIGGVCNIRHQGHLERILRKIFQRGIYFDPRYDYFRNSSLGNFHLINSFLPTFYISASIMALNRSAIKINPFPTRFNKHILGGDIYFGLSCVKKNISVYLSYLISATEIGDEAFDYKSIKSIKKILLSFHSAYHLLKLSGITITNTLNFILRSILICLFAIRVLIKKKN